MTDDVTVMREWAQQQAIDAAAAKGSTDAPRSEAEVRQRITEVESELAKAVRRSHMTNLVGQLEALRWVVRDPSIFSGEKS